MSLRKCPCGRNNTYDLCCGPIHNGIQKAISAEELMRSRYSAFVMANGLYLKASHHSTTRPQSKKELQEIVQFAKSVQWIGLEIIHTKLGRRNDDNGIVEFMAHFNYQGKRDMIHEVSSFKKEAGVWYYLDAIK